jgi:ribonuclease M5
MQSVREVIVVEGRYDKNTLLHVVDAIVIETAGFGIFNDAQKQKLLRRMAEKRGLVVLTDPDGAGFVIRNFIKSCVPPERLKQAYVPDIYGKEKRKARPSREGKLGVEGMRAETLLEALRRAGATFEGSESAENARMISKADLYRLGLSGRENSAKRRAELIREMDLPEHLSADALLDVINATMSREEFLSRAALREKPTR